MQLFPQGFANILPPRAGSAHRDTVARRAAPRAVPGANPLAATSFSTSASQPQPDSTKRRMSAQQASSGCDCDCDSVTACSVAQSAAATEAPTREAAACRALQDPEASAAAAWTQASEARAERGTAAERRRRSKVAAASSSDDDDDLVVALIF